MARVVYKLQRTNPMISHYRERLRLIWMWFRGLKSDRIFIGVVGLHGSSKTTMNLVEGTQGHKDRVVPKVLYIYPSLLQMLPKELQGFVAVGAKKILPLRRNN